MNTSRKVIFVIVTVVLMFVSTVLFIVFLPGNAA